MIFNHLIISSSEEYAKESTIRVGINDNRRVLSEIIGGNPKDLEAITVGLKKINNKLDIRDDGYDYVMYMCNIYEEINKSEEFFKYVRTISKDIPIYIITEKTQRGNINTIKEINRLFNEYGIYAIFHIEYKPIISELKCETILKVLINFISDDGESIAERNN